MLTMPLVHVEAGPKGAGDGLPVGGSPPTKPGSSKPVILEEIGELPP